jgi:D-alanine-D-alanine ligase
VDYDGMETVAVADAELAARLRNASARFFLGLNGAGYGRCDLRVDAQGRLFMLEINVNCGLYYAPSAAGGADRCLANDPAGHAGFTRRIVEAAFRRHARRARPWEVRARPDGRLGLPATRPRAPGEAIRPFDEPARRLVTRAQLEAESVGANGAWLRRQAWPVSDELYGAWSRDPEKWTPIDHSCDPSAWFDGWDVVARRALAPGEEVTLDFATLHDERMAPFDCACGTTSCRGTVRGDDDRRGCAIHQGDHVSPYVRRKRIERPPRSRGRARPARVSR